MLLLESRYQRYSVGEIDLGCYVGQYFVAMPFAALDVDHHFAHRRRSFPIEHCGEVVDARFGGRVVHLSEHDKTDRAFDQSASP